MGKCRKMKTGWWSLAITDIDELTDISKEHIADLIVKGYTSGEIIQEEDDMEITATEDEITIIPKEKK